VKAVFRGYQIGTVANLTGLDPHTIRAWERRYGAVEPRRSEGGTRHYDDDDVARLQLLKALTDCGEPIRLAAALSDDELRRRLERLAGFTATETGASGSAPAEGGELRLGLLHPALAGQLRANAAGLGGLRVNVCLNERGVFLEALRVHPCDALVLDLAQLGSEPLRTVDACLRASGARLTVVVYQFAPRGLLARLAGRGVRLVRGPLRLEQLRRAVLDLVAMDTVRRHRGAGASPNAPATEPLDGPCPERLFDDLQLACLAETSTAVDCECPNHLSSLVSSLLAFEAYSRGCRDRDEADAALHARLALGTGRARALIERLLVDLCEHDGIRV